MKHRLRKKLITKVLVAMIIAIVSCAFVMTNVQTLKDMLFEGEDAVQDVLGDKVAPSNDDKGGTGTPLSSINDQGGIEDGLSGYGPGYSWEFLDAESGKYHIIVADKDGFVFTRGSNEYNQLGLSAGEANAGSNINTVDTAYNSTANYFTYFQPVTALNHVFVTKVAAGGTHSLVIGYLPNTNPTVYKVYAWGDQSDGAVGNGQTSGFTGIPQDITSRFNFPAGVYPTDVSAGENHSMLLDSSGNIYTWGNNAYGQLGLGNTTSYSTPQKINSINGFTAISAGSIHSMAIKGNAIYTWGGNTNLQLGGVSTKTSTSLTPTLRFSGIACNYVSAGELHSAAGNTSTNKIYLWGDNRGGKLGNLSNLTEQNDPKQASASYIEYTGYKKVSAGGMNTFAIDTSNNLKVTGYGGNTYFGISASNTGTFQDTNIDANYIDAGGTYSLIVNTANEMFAYGYAAKYSEFWYSTPDTKKIAGVTYSDGSQMYDTRILNASAEVKTSSTEYLRRLTPAASIIGLPVNYARNGDPATMTIRDGLIFYNTRVKINCFYSNFNDFAVAQVTKSVYDAGGTYGSATFFNIGEKGVVITREGYYVVRYYKNGAVRYTKFTISNKEGPEVILNETDNLSSYYATISLYDAFGLKSVRVSGTSKIFEVNPDYTSGTYINGSYDSGTYNYPTTVANYVYNTTFEVRANSNTTFTVYVVDQNDKAKTYNIAFNTVVSIINENTQGEYTGSAHIIDPLFHRPVDGNTVFGLSTFNSRYAGKGYSVSDVYYSGGDNFTPGVNPPINASTANYTAQFTVSKSGTQIDSKTLNMKINKATPNVSNQGVIKIKYGQPLSAAVLADIARNPHNSGLGVPGTYTWQTPTVIPDINAAVTTRDYLYNFMPTDTVNYVSLTGATATVTIELKTSLEVIVMGSGAPQNTYGYDWANIKVVGNKARIGLAASNYDAGNYIFLGWQKGGTYITVSQNYVYEMTSADVSETDATFRAVFAQYKINNEITKTVNKNYTGDVNRLELYIDLLEAGGSIYSISSTPITYSSGSAPTAIGAYTATFTIRNTYLNEVAATPVINLNVLENDILSVIDVYGSLGYNAETGWAHSVTFNLSVTGVKAGGVQKYMYSKDGGASWHDVPVAPANTLSCPVYFIASAPGSEEVSYSEQYIFKAIHTDYGTGTLKSVATSSTPSNCKIDTITPEVTIGFADGYAGQWTNGNVIFTFNARYGGSGAKILYSYDNETWVDTGLTDYNTGTGTGIIFAAPTWTRSDEQFTGYYFMIRTGTGKETRIGTAHQVRIDKTAPVITYINKNQTPNANGWIKQITTVTLSVAERVNYSGVAEITINNDAVLTYNSGSILPYNNDCFVTLSDYKVYTLTATDVAGNTATYEIQEQVDTKDPQFTVSGYTPGQWISGTAQFDFTVNAGASGVKVLYSTDGGNTYLPFDDAGYLKEGDGSSPFQTITVGYSISEEQSRQYVFKVESGAGRYTTAVFGYVNIDKSAPLIDINNPDWNLDLTQYQGDNPWINYDLEMRFVVADGHPTFNSGISSITVVNGTDNITLTDNGNGRYSFTIDKCTDYTITVTDNVGNTSVKTINAKVDKGEPEFTFAAYIGESDDTYTFDENLWLSAAVHGDDAFVRFVFDMVFSPSGAKMQYSINGGSTWHDLTDVIFEEGNENGMVQHVQITVRVRNEQNNPYMVRMISGSGRVMEGSELGRIRIDFTPPAFESVMTYYVNDTQTNYNDITTKWGYDTVQARFIPADFPSGVKTIEVRRYEIGELTEYTTETVYDNSAYHYFNMDSYARYVLIMTDKAGNVFTNNDIIPLIDKTDGFSFTTNTNGYVSGTWLYDEADEVRFDFNITFDPLSGYSAFGPSGGRIELSVNNGASWDTGILINAIEQEIQDNDTFNPYMIARASQMKTYRFRLITGAGKVYTDSASYTVLKDTVLPEIAYTVTSQGAAYNAQWVNADVVFNLTMRVGASESQYYFGTSQNASIASEGDISWTLIGSLNEGEAVQKTYTVNRTTDSTYYYFRMVAGTGRSCYTSNGSLVKIDKTAISATVTPYYNGEIYGGQWASGQVQLAIKNIVSGPSGVSISYQTRRIGQEVYGEYMTAGYDPETGIITISENTQNEYRIRLLGGSGIDYYPTDIPVRIDNVVPEFAVISEGTQLSGTAQNDGWWTSDLTLTYNVSRAGESGYYPQYSVSYDGVNYGEWTSADITNNILTLTDESVKGGTVRYVKIRVLGGSGLSSAVHDYGEVKIDTNTYSVSVTQYVSTTEGVYATVSNTGSYQRGRTVESVISALEGYYIKSLTVKAGTTVIREDIPADKTTTDTGFATEISGEDITGALYCYKEIAVTYNNREQYLQGRTIEPVTVTVDEEGFDETYGALDFTVSYNGITSIPADIGVYELDATIANDSFIIINPAPDLRKMTIVYFYGTGFESEPYLINNRTDLRYIDYYMSDSADYDYLGYNRKRSAFFQTADITLTPDFTPIGTAGDFTGIYDGGNRKIVYGGTFNVIGSFGLFKRLGENSKVYYLGVEYNINASGSDGNVGLLAAETQGALIIGCYGIGRIDVTGVNINAGGLVGKAVATIMGSLYADVSMYADDLNGNVGGMVGWYDTYSPYLNFISNYILSGVTVTGDSTCSAGSVIGILMGDINYQEGSDSYINIFNVNNLTINGVPYAAQGVGNQGEWGVNGVQAKVFEVFTGSEAVIGNIEYPGFEQRAVRELVKYRLQTMGVSGLGIESDPFLIDSAQELGLIEIFPFAYFRQTDDIVLGSFNTFNIDKVFTGTYDGGLYSIIRPTINTESQYGGLFGIVKGSIINVRLVDIDFTFTSGADRSFAGGLAAVALQGSVLADNIVSGSIKVSNNADRGVLYAGGLVGVVNSATVTDCISLVNINIENAYSVVVGGVIAQAEGATFINSIVSLARVSASYTGNGLIGSTIGSIFDNYVSGSNIYNVSGNTYANGKIFDYSIGVNGSQNISGISAQDYDRTVSAASGITVSGSDVLTLINNLYPFDGGTGTYNDPFLISNYAQLLRIGDYMYASFELTDDIVIGDYDDDGVVDDDYDYDFDTIGKGAIFTGTLDGLNHSIYGLTDALFAINAGQIKNIYLNVYYAAYYDGHPALNTDPRAKKLSMNEDVVFGSAARYNRAGGSIKMVIVNGEIKIETMGKGRVKAGGIVGSATGGSILGSISYVSLNVKSIMADIGGVVGSVEGDLRIDSSILTTVEFNIILESINAYGSIINAGLIVGALRSSKAVIDENSQSSVKVYINGIQQPAEDSLIGMRAFNN